MVINKETLQQIIKEVEKGETYYIHTNTLGKRGRAKLNKIAGVKIETSRDGFLTISKEVKGI